MTPAQGHAGGSDCVPLGLRAGRAGGEVSESRAHAPRMRDAALCPGRSQTSVELYGAYPHDAPRSEWSTLCMSGRGFGAQQSPDVAGEMYSPEYSAEMLKQQARALALRTQRPAPRFGFGIDE